ncbi:Splicing factor U2af large subunit B [Bienertia sinuspersici]
MRIVAMVVETMTDGRSMMMTERTAIDVVLVLVPGLDLIINQDHALVQGQDHVHVLRGPITTAPVPGVLPNMFPLTSGQMQLGTLPVMPVQAMTQQATRHARRVYVGGLPPTANEQSVATFFSHVMASIGGNTAGPGRSSRFCEVNGTPVKVRRPSDYNPSLAAALGPSQPNPDLNLGAVGLTPGSAGGLEGPDRIFVGGLPYYFTEAQVRELLESFGALRDIVCQALNGIKMGDKTLTVRRANQGTQQPKPEQESVYMHAQQQIALQKMILQPGGLPTKVVCLTNCVNQDELGDDEEFEDILEDMRQEGSLVNVFIPRPHPNGEPSPGLGKVFLEYADVESSSKARAGMNGRKFGGNQVVAIFYPENKFAEGVYDG